MSTTDVQIAVFAHSLNDFNSCKKNLLESVPIHPSAVHFCDSKIKSRISFCQELPNQWILFLDSDCHVTSETWNLITKQNLSIDCVLAGTYVNPDNPGYFQKSHNLIANAWLENSFHEGNSPYVLGGSFLIYSNPKLQKLASASMPLFWGAEDKQLALQLSELGITIKKEPSFVVTHHCSKKLSHFMRRAWLQGVNDDFSKDEFSLHRKNKISKHWLSLLAPTNLWLAPAVLLHFSILMLGKWFQLIHPKHMKIKSKRSLVTPVE